MATQKNCCIDIKDIQKMQLIGTKYYPKKMENLAKKILFFSLNIIHCGAIFIFFALKMVNFYQKLIFYMKM